MYKLKPKHLKELKSIHLLFAGVWLSGVLIMAFIPLLNIKTGDELYIYNLIYYFIDMAFITVSAIITLITGLIYSILTHGGFFNHGWIVYKWIVTIVTVITGTFSPGPMTEKLLTISDTLMN